MDRRDHLIQLYFSTGMSYTDILYLLHKHGYIISYRHVQRILQQHGLSRRNYSYLNDAVLFIRQQLQTSGSLHGYRWMHQKLKNSGLNVRKEDVRELLSILDPDGTSCRKSRRLRRRLYFAKGPNYVWHMDSYDKLKPFGICINGSIDGFSRKIIWLNAYYTSSDPKVIAGYYTEVVEKLKGTARIIRADNGTENTHVRDLQRLLRRDGQDAFGGMRSFLSGRSTMNQRIEYWWAFLRKECTDFWLNLFLTLKHSGNFDGDFVDRNLLLFCFLGLVQVIFSPIQQWLNLCMLGVG